MYHHYQFIHDEKWLTLCQFGENILYNDDLIIMQFSEIVTFPKTDLNESTAGIKMHSFMLWKVPISYTVVMISFLKMMYADIAGTYGNNRLTWQICCDLIFSTRIVGG